jgi:hypothetical protein
MFRGEGTPKADYQIEELKDSGGNTRRRLLIMKDGERRGALVLDSREQGEEIIKRLNGEPVKFRRSVKIDFEVGKIDTSMKPTYQVRPLSGLFRLFVGERIIWLTLAGVSWAVSISIIVTKHIL